MRDLFPRLWSLLPPSERRKLLPLVLAMAFGAFLELLGLGLVMPVIAVLANPDLIEQNKYLRIIHGFINPGSDVHFLLILCFSVAAVYIVKNMFLAIETRMQVRFVYRLGERIASRLFDNYIHAPYVFHLSKNSSEILNNINMVGTIAGGLFMPAMMFLAEMIVVASILGLLLFFAPYATLGLAVVSMIIVAGLYYPFKRYNLLLGERILLYSKEAFQDVMQGFEGIKECKIRTCEPLLSRRHEAHQRLLREAEASRNFFNQLPRFCIEALVVVAGMGTLAAFVLAGVATGSIVLKLSLIAVAMVRLMPSFSRIQYQLTSIRQNLYAFNRIYSDLEKLAPAPASLDNKPPMALGNSICLEGVSFSYPGAQSPVISGLSMEIPRNSSVAFVGPTGCGKTTLMDMILGLLKPTAGRISVDGRDIEENLPSWQRKIGYVPQFIFLMDASIRENVAFGEERDSIDDAQVRKCLETAQLLDFAESLPGKLNAMVGERGVRLSGGQRQRIGIARALYRNPEVLALDEATSALDNDTEKAFVDALKSLKGKLTIIMIAHRLTTVENCDRIVNLKAG